MMGLNESSLNQIDILIGKAQETAWKISNLEAEFVKIEKYQLTFQVN
jgi:hypothetical protein